MGPCSHLRRHRCRWSVLEPFSLSEEYMEPEFASAGRGWSSTRTALCPAPVGGSRTDLVPQALAAPGGSTSIEAGSGLRRAAIAVHDAVDEREETAGPFLAVPFLSSLDYSLARSYQTRPSLIVS